MVPVIHRSSGDMGQQAFVRRRYFRAAICQDKVIVSHLNVAAPQREAQNSLFAVAIYRDDKTIINASQFRQRQHMRRQNAAHQLMMRGEACAKCRPYFGRVVIIWRSEFHNALNPSCFDIFAVIPPVLRGCGRFLLGGAWLLREDAKIYEICYN